MKLHPDNLKEVNSIEIDGKVSEFITNLDSDISSSENERGKWEKYVDRLEELRYCVRPKKVKPWPGCANYSIPLIDTDIARIKPSYINLAFSVSPICTFVPFGPEDVEPMRKREELFDWRMRTQVKFFEPYCYGVDQVLGSRGMTVFRTIWKFATRNYHEKIDITELPAEVQEVLYDPRMTDELISQIIIEELMVNTSYEENLDEIDKAVKKFREGETVIELDLVETSDDRPEVTACDIRRDIVVPYNTKDINDARFIDYRYYVSKNDLKINMLDGLFREYSDDEIIAWIDIANNSKNNGTNFTSDSILLHEVCCWYDINDDGIEERCIATYPDADPSSVLRFIQLPYDHGQWPYVQVKRELNDDGFYNSRGIAALDEDFQEGISTSVNQAIDNGTILNSPERVVRSGVLTNIKNRRFIPGEVVEVNGSPNDYQTRVSGNVTQGVLFQNAQYLKSWSDARLSNISTGSDNNLPGSGERGKKTAAEINTMAIMQQNATSLDLQVFQQQMAKVYYQIDALYNQYGNEEEEFLITGENKRKVSRYEIQGKFDIVPNGRMDNNTPGMRLQKTMFALNVGANSPIVKQDVLINEAFEDLGPRFKGAIKTKEEMAQEAQAQQEAIQRSKQEALLSSIQAKKVSDDLDVRKEILLAPVQGKKYAPD